MPSKIARDPKRVGSPSRLWPDTVEALDALPLSLQPLAASALAGEQPLGLLLVPWDTQPTRWWREQVIPSRLIALTRGRLIVFRGDEDGIPCEAWETPLARLLTVEWGQILLYSWVGFTAAGDAGVSEARVLYNTVGRDHAWRLLAKIMATLAGEGPAGGEPAGLDLTERLPLKFQNAIRHDLFPGDRLLAVAHQPFQATRFLHLAWRERFPESVLAATARYVLLLREEKPVLLQSGRNRTIATYAPLGRIDDVEVEATTGTGEAATVRLDLAVGAGATVEHVRQPFSPELRPELEVVVERIRQCLDDRAVPRIVDLAASRGRWTAPAPTANRAGGSR